ncbi:LexA family protein [Tunicatimonas pelagia]|uniref:LexA family protein n=1 Tax=Tunicatimonas pelagia TaxID=931531 RepID=UPI002666DAC5|nr:translesion error-prone DNA polymerase V autoproteolytic subunit [Tunicatimonas pelagia]WKN46443.1 translesion error-prone DNA polymerase V autoproteolytic subunit [Tunicatimonas pelagia]
MRVQPIIYLPRIITECPVPMYGGQIPAGFPSPAADHQEQPIDLNRELIPHPDSTFLVRASGHSMTGAGIFDGDLLVVDRSLTAKDGYIIIASVYGELTVKRLSIRTERGNKQYVLCAEHPDYPEIYMPLEDSVIWGVVRHTVRDLLNSK